MKDIKSGRKGNSRSGSREKKKKNLKSYRSSAEKKDYLEKFLERIDREANKK